MKKVIGLFLLALVQQSYAASEPVIERCKNIVFKAKTHSTQEFMVCELNTGRYAYRQRDSEVKANNVTFFTDKDNVTSKLITNEGVYAAEIVMTDENNTVYNITVWSREDKRPDGLVRVIKPGEDARTFELKSSTITSKIGR